MSESSPKNTNLPNFRDIANPKDYIEKILDIRNRLPNGERLEIVYRDRSSSWESRRDKLRLRKIALESLLGEHDIHIAKDQKTNKELVTLIYGLANDLAVYVSLEDDFLKASQLPGKYKILFVVAPSRIVRSKNFRVNLIRQRTTKSDWSKIRRLKEKYPDVIVAVWTDPDVDPVIERQILKDLVELGRSKCASFIGRPPKRKEVNNHRWKNIVFDKVKAGIRSYLFVQEISERSGMHRCTVFRWIRWARKKLKKEQGNT